MSRLIGFVLATLLCSIPLWSQVEPSATGGSGVESDDTYMTMPAPVSGSFYRSVLGGHRENYLSGGVATSASYDDNILVNDTAKPISGEVFSIYPSIGLATSTGRTRADLSYSTGFSFYQPTTDLNAVNQNLAADFQYKFSPRTTLTGQDVFMQNSSVFSQPYTLSGATISGSSQSVAPIVIVPYANEITDSTGASIGYQFSRNSMIGGGGSYSLFRFTNANQDAGLFGSTSEGGSAFYSLRVTRGQSIGVRYGYLRSTFDSYSTNTDDQSSALFYALKLGHSFSMSVSGGASYVTTSATGAPTASTWAPSGTASFGWQGTRTNVTFAYAREVSTGWGFVGAYQTDGASVSIGHKFTRKLAGSIGGSYADVQNISAIPTSSNVEGHSLFGRASLAYPLSEHMTAAADYSRIHENYSSISEIAIDPNADRVTVSLNYLFRRPLGK